jgi:class 3 adenylate cyclase
MANREKASQVEHGVLAAAVEAMRRGRLAAQLFDAAGRLRWISPQLVDLVGAEESDEFGVGTHFMDGLELPLWQGVLTPESVRRLREELHRHTDHAEPTATPVWVFPIEVRLSRRHRSIGVLGISLRGADGPSAGVLLIYAPPLPARVLALVSEGDEAMFTRMAGLVHPAPRPAAVLFADIGASAVLSRQLPTAAYFELIRQFTTEFDATVAHHLGIVGKHAGDGASAFFLTEHHADDSGAARAAVETALHLPAATRAVASALAEGWVGLDPDRLMLNIGLHWGPNLYIGQVVTGGRLEVTALGDEVNECARVQQVATGGQILATKALLERLTEADASAVHLDRRRIVYTALAELADANPKALRDAGTLAVTRLRAPSAPDRSAQAPRPD